MNHTKLTLIACLLTASLSYAVTPTPTTTSSDSATQITAAVDTTPATTISGTEANKTALQQPSATTATNGTAPSTEELFNLINTNVNASGGMVPGSDVTTASQLLPTMEPKDALAGYNKFMFKVNDKLDTYIAKPAANLYTKIIPHPLFNMINNAFINIDTIPTVANDLLQANFYQATSDAWRLTINSTAGIGGAFDVATDMGLQFNYEDFGLTMAKWGWTSSNYFVIPILGPSSIRDALGRPVNYYMSIFPYIKPKTLEWSIYIAYLINERAQYLKAQGVYDSAALDPSVFMRNAYLQRRDYLIKRNNELNNPYTKKDMKKYYNPYYLYE